MKRSYLLIPILTALCSLQTQAQTIFSHTFNEGTGSLNGTAVDTGTGNWVSGVKVVVDEVETVVTPGVVNANGAFSGVGSATLAFTPSQGTQYQLDARITGVSGNANWVALGFANGTSEFIGTGHRFTTQPGVTVEGRAWMLFRGDSTSSGNVAWTEGSKSGNNATWSALANTAGGDIDMRILLDTTNGAGTWTATWFAKLTGDGSYSEVRSLTTLPNEDITSVGFAFAADTVSGTLSSMTLTQVPEPSVFALIAGCFGLSWVMIRRRRS